MNILNLLKINKLKSIKLVGVSFMKQKYKNIIIYKNICRSIILKSIKFVGV